jgi:hypothetical protein
MPTKAKRPELFSGKSGPVYDSRFYQFLVAQERKGTFRKMPSLDNTTMERGLDKFIGPRVEHFRKWLLRKDANGRKTAGKVP